MGDLPSATQSERGGSWLGLFVRPDREPPSLPQGALSLLPRFCLSTLGKHSQGQKWGGEEKESRPERSLLGRELWLLSAVPFSGATLLHLRYPHLLSVEFSLRRITLLKAMILSSSLSSFCSQS